jgi:hypothetical protein
MLPYAVNSTSESRICHQLRLKKPLTSRKANSPKTSPDDPTVTPRPPISQTARPEPSQLQTIAVRKTRSPDMKTRKPKITRGSALDSTWLRLECSSGKVKMSSSPSGLRGLRPKTRFSPWSNAVLSSSMAKSSSTKEPTTSNPPLARAAGVSRAAVVSRAKGSRGSSIVFAS